MQLDGEASLLQDELQNFEEESELFKHGTTKDTKSVVFSLKNDVGNLANALTVFKVGVTQTAVRKWLAQKRKRRMVRMLEPSHPA